MKVFRKFCRFGYIGIVLMLPAFAFAQADFVPLITIPGFENPQDLEFEDYINTLYVIAIGAAALIAVVKLILAGFQYLLSDIVTRKEDAKKQIQTALLGLLIILSAVTILRTINPQLVNLSALTPIQVEERVRVVREPTILDAGRNERVIVRVNPETGEREIDTVGNENTEITILGEDEIPDNNTNPQDIINLFLNDYTVTGDTLNDVDLGRLRAVIPDLTYENFLQKIEGMVAIETAAIFAAGYESENEFVEIVLKPFCQSGRVIPSSRRTTTTFFCLK